jgi:hypothetical protein
MPAAPQSPLPIGKRVQAEKSAAVVRLFVGVLVFGGDLTDDALADKAERLVAAGAWKPELVLLRSGVGVRFFMEPSPHLEPLRQAQEIVRAARLAPVGPFTFGRVECS